MALAVAVPAEGAAPVDAVAPDRFNGVFVLDSKRSDPISPVLKELGVPWIARKMADSSSVTLTLHRSGDDFTSESKNFFRTQTQRMRLNGGVRPHGRKEEPPRRKRARSERAHGGPARPAASDTQESQRGSLPGG